MYISSFIVDFSNGTTHPAIYRVWAKSKYYVKWSLGERLLLEPTTASLLMYYSLLVDILLQLPYNTTAYQADHYGFVSSDCIPLIRMLNSIDAILTSPTKCRYSQPGNR